MENWSAYVGYLASIFIVGSFLLKDIKTIRFINLIGCICFVLYGFFIDPAGYLWPIIIPNGLLSLVQIYHLVIKKA